MLDIWWTDSGSLTTHAQSWGRELLDASLNRVMVISKHHVISMCVGQSYGALVVRFVFSEGCWGRELWGTFVGRVVIVS